MDEDLVEDIRDALHEIEGALVTLAEGLGRDERFGGTSETLHRRARELAKIVGRVDVRMREIRRAKVERLRTGIDSEQRDTAHRLPPPE